MGALVFIIYIVMGSVILNAQIINKLMKFHPQPQISYTLSFNYNFYKLLVQKYFALFE